jgi:hypothetical protein
MSIGPSDPFLPDGLSTVRPRAGGFYSARKMFQAGLYQSGDEIIRRAEWFPPALVAGGERGYTSGHPAPHVREASMPKKERDRELSRRRQKRKKMEFLKGRLAETKDSKARAILVQKILKINPQANVSPK